MRGYESRCGDSNSDAEWPEICQNWNRAVAHNETIYYYRPISRYFNTHTKAFWIKLRHLFKKVWVYSPPRRHLVAFQVWIYLVRLDSLTTYMNIATYDPRALVMTCAWRAFLSRHTPVPWNTEGGERRGDSIWSCWLPHVRVAPAGSTDIISSQWCLSGIFTTISDICDSKSSLANIYIRL